MRTFRIAHNAFLIRKETLFMDANRSMKYSVLMSVYAKEKEEYLRQSIDSMLNQTVKPEQFVLVEDGSLGDDLRDCIGEYVALYSQMFTVVPLVENVGLGRALDIGLEHCRNELVVRMDSDDISLPNRCEKEINEFLKDRDLTICGSNIDEFYDDPKVIQTSRIVPSEPEEIAKRIGRITPFNHPSVMYKKSAVVRCGGYGTLRRKQDRDLFSRMINMGCKARNINESLVLFRSNEDNYKRRKSWTYCKTTIDVTIGIWKRGHCTLGDLIYVITGQMILFVMPLPIMRWISDTWLRRKARTKA